MKILEQTSTHLTLQDSTGILWMTRIVSGIFFVWSSADIILSVFKPSFFSLLILIHIIGFSCFSLAFALFPSRNTVNFDKDQKKLTLIYESVLKKKTIEYLLDEIINVVAEEKLDSDGSYYNVVLKLSSGYQDLPLSQTSFISSNQARETAHLLRNFLEMTA